MPGARAIRRVSVTAGVALLLAVPAGGAEAQELQAPYRAEGVAAGPADPRWEEAPSTPLELSAQLIAPPVGGGSLSKAAVRAMHDGEWLAIRLEWTDPTADREVGVDTFRDAAALGFPQVASAPLPSPFMGDAEHPVVIWQWTADLEAGARGRGGFAERYPHTEGVWYFPQDAMVRRRVRAWRETEPVAAFVATSWGTLTPRDGQDVHARSTRRDDRWVVVFRRLLDTGHPQAARFRAGETTHLVAAVWNGKEGDVNGRKSVTLGWIPMALEATLEVDDGER